MSQEMDPERLETYQKVSISELPLWNFVGDPRKRWEAFHPFVQPILDRYDNPLILDAAMGSGPDALMLLVQGRRVVCNEIDPIGIEQARTAAQQQQIDLDIRQVNWTQIAESSEYQTEEFDVVYSLGNSFPNYLLSGDERRRALQGFWQVLRPGGTLLFDARNFDYVLNERKFLLADPQRNFEYRYATTYTGRQVQAFPITIEDNRTRFRWVNSQNHHYAELDLWPATVERVHDLIQETLGDQTLETFYDFQAQQPEHYDFAQFVIRK